MTKKSPGGRHIGFLGPRGTFTEGAARTYVAASGVRIDRGTSTAARDADDGKTDEGCLRAFDEIPALLQAVARGDVDEAVVPVENSIEGTVNVTLDTLVHDVDLTVVADIVLPIRHHLLVPPGVDWRDVRVVVSHPQALAQCRRWLHENLPGVQVEAALSTAAAAARIGGDGQNGDHGSPDPPRAAIGNGFSAALYGLHLAVKDIQDESINETRFFVVAPGSVSGGPSIHGKEDDGGREYTTSVAFAFAADGPGNLYGALGEFARRGVNLTKLESRPARQALGHYIFFVDMDGRIDDEDVAAALDALRRECTFVKVLGSYRRVPSA